MNGQDFQDRFEALYVDLQKPANRGKVARVLFRGLLNVATIFLLSSDSFGVIDDTQRENLQAEINRMKPIANFYEAETLSVRESTEQLKAAALPYESLRIAAQTASDIYRDALADDAVYQSIKAALDAAKLDLNYLQAVEEYRTANISENYGNLSDAKGKYSDAESGDDEVVGGGGIIG